MLKVHAMARTVANDPLQKFKFRVTIPGLPTGIGFTKVSGLNREIEVAEHNESGYGTTLKLTGKEKFTEIVLERGSYANNDMAKIYKESLGSNDFRRTVIIELLDKLGNVARKWTILEAWVSKIEDTDLDASSSDVAIEKMTIQHEGFLD